MALIPLIRSFAEWPLLICGPILRRVTEREVAVFAATRVPCNVQLTVGIAGSNIPSLTNTNQPTRALGRSLHVTVSRLEILETTPDADKIKPGVVYEYDLQMTPLDGGSTQTLAQQPGLLTGEQPLGYGEDALPTFSLPPPGLAELNLLHASCRKPHGGGPDALAMADHLIGQSRTGAPEVQARKRPHHLLLTGDQIYADDVALTMLTALQEAALLLCPRSPGETFPGGVPLASPKVAPGRSREKYLKDNASLSSEHGMNHLMYFAEFCAMYVMCWSDELWPRGADGKLILGDAVVEADLKKTDAKERAELLVFLRTLRRARRALANVPTLMMFDDHEISDDWYLDADWFDNTRSAQARPTQRQIVRNGLLAFAVFQAWGNDPARFEAGIPKALLDAVSAVPPAGNAPPIATDPALVDVPLDVTDEKPDELRMTWDWTVDWPRHRVIALDSRTRRDYNTVGRKSPGLLTTAELERQLTSNKPKPIEARLCFVIAPGPVVGHPLVEQAVGPVYALVQGGRAADNESWRVNRFTYEEMLRRLAEFGRVIVLSGDVHYGFTNHSAYFGANGQQPARIVQLCSSAIKNTDVMTLLIQALGYLESEGEDWLGFAAPLTAGTREKLLVALEPDENDRTKDKVYKFLVNRVNRIRIFQLMDKPAVVPAGPWSSEAFEEVKRLADSADPNDWRYRVRFGVDPRTGSERLDMAFKIDPRIPPSSWKRVWEQVARQGRRAVVGEPNLGQVLLRSADGKDSVEHRLHWMTDADPDKGVQTCTQHIVPLGAPGQDERPVPFRRPVPIP